MVICLEQGASDLHMVQLMPLPPVVSASEKCRMVYPCDTVLPRLSWKKGCWWTVVVMISLNSNKFVTCTPCVAEADSDVLCLEWRVRNCGVGGLLTICHLLLLIRLCLWMQSFSFVLFSFSSSTRSLSSNMLHLTFRVYVSIV